MKNFIITKKMLISQLAEKYPELVEVLTEKYGFHCVGCSMAGMETLADGAMVHGMTEKETDKMIADLNKKISGKKI